MKQIPEMTDSEKIAHIRRLKRAGVKLADIEDLMQVSIRDIKKIFHPNFMFMTSEQIAEKLTLKTHV